MLEYKYFALRYNGTGETECATVNDPTLFDFQWDTKEKDTTKITNYSVQFMYYDASGNTSNKSSSLVCKATRSQPGTNEGWSIYRRYGTAVCRNTGSVVYSLEDGTDRLNDKVWHVFTLVWDLRKKEFRYYLDGNFENHGHKVTKLSKNPGTAPLAPLTIGQVNNSNKSKNTPFFITNLQVYDVALPEEWIARNYKKTYIDREGAKFKYWQPLIGYWPMDREEDYGLPVLRDYSQYGSVQGGQNAGRSDMTIKNATWATGHSAEPNISPLIDASYYQRVLNTIDITYQSLQWLGITPSADWQLEGIGRAMKQ